MNSHYCIAMTSLRRLHRHYFDGQIRKALTPTPIPHGLPGSLGPPQTSPPSSLGASRIRRYPNWAAPGEEPLNTYGKCPVAFLYRRWTCSMGITVPTRSLGQTNHQASQTAPVGGYRLPTSTMSSLLSGSARVSTHTVPPQPPPVILAPNTVLPRCWLRNCICLTNATILSVPSDPNPHLE